MKEVSASWSCYYWCFGWLFLLEVAVTFVWVLKRGQFVETCVPLNALLLYMWNFINGVKKNMFKVAYRVFTQSMRLTEQVEESQHTSIQNTGWHLGNIPTTCGSMSCNSHWLNATAVQNEFPHSFLHLRVRIATKRAMWPKVSTIKGKRKILSSKISRVKFAKLV